MLPDYYTRRMLTGVRKALSISGTINNISKQAVEEIFGSGTWHRGYRKRLQGLTGVRVTWKDWEWSRMIYLDNKVAGGP